MSNTLTERLDALGSQSVDYSDPTTYANLLGYNDEPGATETPAQGDTSAEPTTNAAPAAGVPAQQEGSASPAAAEASEADVAGIATKDGKRVIPFAVLQDTRNAAAAANAKAKDLEATVLRLQQELEGKASGKGAQTSAQTDAPIDFTDEELADIEADFPQMGKLAKAYRALSQKVEEVGTRQQVPVEQKVDVQALIDTRPLLSQWQAKGGVAWSAAVQLDKALQADPAWADKPELDRFVEVERRIADEFGIQIANPTLPRPAVPAIPVATTVTPTLTDFNGGAPAVGDPMAAMPVGRMVDAAMNMDMDSLRKMAGLSY